jgi:hypothetical protein
MLNDPTKRPDQGTDSATSRRPHLSLAAFLALAWLAAAAHLFIWAKRHPDGNIVRGHDDSRYFAIAHSLWIDGDLDMANEFALLAPEALEERTPIGRIANKYGVGGPILSAPPLLAARLLGADSLGRGAQSAYFLWHALLGLAGVALFGVAAGRVVRSAWAGAFAAAALLCGTSAAWYVLFQPTMSHAAELLCGGGLLFAWERRYVADDARWRWPALMGLAIGFGAAVRLQDAPMVVLFAASEALRLGRAGAARSWRDSALAGVAFGLCAAAGVFPHLLYQKLLWGSWLLNAYAAGGERFYWASPSLAGLLFSTRNSLFFYAPLALAATAGLAMTARRGLGAQAWALAILFAANVYVNAAWHAWWMGHSFGARGLLNCFGPWCAGLAALFARAGEGTPRSRKLVLAGVLLAIGWTAALAALYYLALIPHDGSGYDPLSLPARIGSVFGKVLSKLGGG